jgi:hypothetical protein
VAKQCPPHERHAIRNEEPSLASGGDCEKAVELPPHHAWPAQSSGPGEGLGSVESDPAHRGGPAPQDTYRFDVQLSENASALVENGRFSRSRFQDLPAACLPLRVSRVPSAGTSTVHTP